jgi:RNA polymerase sigma-70 factor, ECF subfamily
MVTGDATADETLPIPDAGRPACTRAADDESMTWITALSSEGSEREDARDRLHAVLLRAARSELARRARADGDHSQALLDDLAVRATDAALAAIERDLRTYRGQSRFTTWAAKFALYEAAVQFHLHAWRDRPLPTEADGLALLVRAQGDGDIGAQTAARLCRLREVLASRLTEHQRFVVIALAVNEVPIDVLAERLGTTRGALYESLHEARLAIRRELSETALAELER